MDPSENLPVMPSTQLPRAPAVEEAIRRRAQELYEQRGRVDGHQVEDWLQAESEVLRRNSAPANATPEPLPSPTRKSGFVLVRIDGMLYTGEYDLDHAHGYHPGELGPGTPIEVRFEGERMYIKRRNGRELESRIVRKVAASARGA